jgi:hypothetical protein
MKRVLLLLLTVVLISYSVKFAAAAECYYEGKAYSDGAKNPIGQVCDGQTGSWKG